MLLTSRVFVRAASSSLVTSSKYEVRVLALEHGPALLDDDLVLQPHREVLARLGLC